MNDYDRQDLIKQRTGLEPPAHEGDYWSDEDRARLKCLFDMGFGISEIALERIWTCLSVSAVGTGYAPRFQAAACAKNARQTRRPAPSAGCRKQQRRLCNV